MIITKDRGVSKEELMRLRRESNVLDESILSWTNYYDVRNFTIMPLYIWRKCQRDMIEVKKTRSRIYREGAVI
jgi:hypothetical protein